MQDGKYDRSNPVVDWGETSFRAFFFEKSFQIFKIPRLSAGQKGLSRLIEKLRQEMYRFLFN